MTGNEKELVIVTATFPENFKTEFSLPMKQSALSVQWDAVAENDPLAGLNFTFKDDPSLKFLGTLANGALFTNAGGLPSNPNNYPLFVIAPSLTDAPISDIGQFARNRLMLSGKFTGIAVRKQSDITIAGMPGSEIIADGKWADRPGQPPVVIYQVFLRDGNSYFLMQGAASPEESEKYLPTFSRIANSFRKK